MTQKSRGGLGVLAVLVGTLMAACGAQTGTPNAPVSAAPTATAVSIPTRPATPARTAAAPAPTSVAPAPTTAKPAPTSAPAAAAASDKVIDPCTLITKDEAEAALGLKFDQGTVARDGAALGGNGADCNFETANPADPSFTLHTMNGKQFMADRSISVQKWISIASGDKNTEPVSGVGDAAFWSASLQTLEVAKGDFYLSLLGVDIRHQYEFKLDPLKTLAQKAVARL